MAILVAGGVVGSTTTVSSQPLSIKPSSEQNLLEQFADCKNLNLSLRSCYLLQAASTYMRTADKKEVDSQLRPLLNKPDLSRLLTVEKTWKFHLSSMAQQAALDSQSAGSKPVNNRELAEIAVDRAVNLLGDSETGYSRLNLYFIASCTYKRLGAIKKMHNCDEVIEKAIKGCESNTSSNEEQVESVVSVLDAMSYGYVPIRIFDWKNVIYEKKSGKQNYSEKDFKAAERLRLRALALVDRLESGSHLRRKAHRDMVLWYERTGKANLAERQKTILFELVGVQSDKILYPQSSGCGNVIWWKAETIRAHIACGMG